MNIGYPFRTIQRITSDYAAHLKRRAKSPGTDWGVPVGTEYLAVEDGWATPAYKDSYGGIYQFLKSTDRTRSWMGLHHSKVTKSGDVRKGDKLTETGNTGLSTGPHLHLSLKVNGNFVNPETYLNSSNKPTVSYRLEKRGNNLHAIFSGGFVGELKTERLDGPNAGSVFSSGYINRPNGGDGGPIVANMDQIRYKVLVPNDHKIFDNRSQTNPEPKPIPVDNPEVLKLRQEIESLEKLIAEQAEKHEQELKEDAKNDAAQLLILEGQISEKDKEIINLREEQADLILKLEDARNLGIEIQDSTVAKFLGDIGTEVVTTEGPIKNWLSKYNNAISKIPYKKIRELLKYDLFIFLALNATVIITLITGAIPTSVVPADTMLVIVNILGTLAVGFKQMVTTFYGGEDGELNSLDYRVLKDYLDEEIDKV